MRTIYPNGLNKGLGSKFRDGSRLRQEGSRARKEGSRVRQEIPEEGRKVVQITMKMRTIVRITQIVIIR